jgi:phage replication O-like protein O
MTKIPQSNYTQIPNVFFDNIMSKINGSEFKVLMAISRMTFGWHKEIDRISYSQIMEMTGISSKETVNNSIKKLISKDIIKLEKVGQVNYYTVNVTEIEPVQKSNQYENCTGDSTEIVPAEQKTGTKIVHTKEKNLNKDKENNKELKIFDDEAYTLASLLSELHIQNIDTGCKKLSEKQKQTWAGDIEKLHRIDGRSYQDIEKAIRKIKTNGQFWGTVVMSGSKLREKFPTIWAQINQRNGYSKPLPVQTRTAFLDMED